MGVLKVDQTVDQTAVTMVDWKAGSLVVAMVETMAAQLVGWLVD